jgi:predicted transcriptional regulator
MPKNVATLGELERAVMDALWAADEPRTAYELQETLAARALAATTVLTVLSRLEKKGFVAAAREARPHRYHAATTRAEAMAELMHEVLGAENDRVAVLERFVGGVSADDAAVLRRLLER